MRDEPMTKEKMRNGHSMWEESDSVDDRMVPCVVHGVTTVYGVRPGERVCSACVREGMIPRPQEFRPPTAADEEAERAVDAEVRAKLTAEHEREMLRRERIDFAIQRGDLDELERLGAGEAAVKEVRSRLAGQPGGVGGGERETSPLGEDATRPLTEADDPVRRVAVGARLAAVLSREPDSPAHGGGADGAVDHVPASPDAPAQRVAEAGRVTDDSLEDYILGLAGGS
jgi:hypothetical protein